jgi:hypothetical protein
MVDKSLIYDFKKEIDSKFNYKLNNLEDMTIEVIFKTESLEEWNKIKEICNYYWNSYEHICTFNEDFNSVIIDEAKSNLTNLISEPKIPDKRKYFKYLIIFMSLGLVVSIVSAAILINLSNEVFDIQNKIIIAVMIFLIIGLIIYIPITYIFLEKLYRKNLLNMVISSSFIDVLLIIAIQHFSLSKIFIRDNFSDTVLNTMLIIMYTFSLAVLLSMISYAVRVLVLKQDEKLKIYNRLKNKGYSIHKDKIYEFCDHNKIRLTDVFLSKDGTNDFFGLLGMQVDPFAENEFLKVVSMIIIPLFTLGYYWTVMSELNTVTQIILVLFILIKTIFSIITGINKDKLILINATFYMEKLVNFEIEANDKSTEQS